LSFLDGADGHYRVVVQPLVGAALAGAPVVGPTADSVTWAPDAQQLALTRSADGFGEIKLYGRDFDAAPVTVVDAEYPVTGVSWQWLEP
jgi:hypothetical protein